jgi:hypothetical protein
VRRNVLSTPRDVRVFPAPDWEIYRNFNVGTIGASTTGNANGFDDGGSATVYTTEQVFAGAQAAKSTISPNQSGTFNFGGWITRYPSNFFRGDSVWFQGYYYVPASFFFGIPRIKFLRFGTRSPSVSNQGFVDTYINPLATPSSTYDIIYEGDQSSGDPWTPAGPAATIDRDRWIRINKHVVFDNLSTNNGGMARVRLWQDGVLLADKTDRRTLVDLDSFSSQFLNFTYWNGENAPQVQSLYIDELRLAKNGIPLWAADLQGV